MPEDGWNFAKFFAIIWSIVIIVVVSLVASSLSWCLVSAVMKIHDTNRIVHEIQEQQKK